MHSGADSPGYGDDVSIPNAAMSRPGMTKIAEKGDQHDCNSGKLPLRRREIRNHRTTAEPIKLPLLALPQTARRALPEPRTRAG